METIDAMLQDVPIFRGLTPGRLALLAGCAQNVHFDDESTMFREGEPADTFYLVRHGSVALSTFVPRRGPVTIETIDAGDVVGWSWLFPPYCWQFDARAVGAVRATAFDGVCLRDKCEADTALGYDLHVAVRPGARRAPAVDAAPSPGSLWRQPRLSSRRGNGAAAVPRRVAAARDPDTWTLELEPVNGEPIASRRASSRCSTRSGSARCPSRSPARRAGRSSRPCAPSAPCPRRSAPPSPARCSACAGRTGTRGRSTRRSAATS